MLRSVDLAMLSAEEPGKTKPKVGVVIVRDGDVLGESYRGETGPGRHAEFGLVERLGKDRLRGATVFTTLEPCSRRNQPKKPCAQHLIDARVDTVFIGVYDPNPLIYRDGWRMLRDAGIMLRDYPPDLRARIAADNTSFFDSFRLSVGDRGSATFDYTQNAGNYELAGSRMRIVTRWTPRGPNSVYAIDNFANVASARYAREFGEIDDPGALDWSNYSVGAEVGEIVAFRCAEGYALIKVTEVFAGIGRGADHTALHFDYELRYGGDQ